MITEELAQVGKKGEILPKKKLREVAGIFPGDHVLIKASANGFVIKKVVSVEEAFNLEVIDSATPLELRKQIKKELQTAQLGNFDHP